MKSAANVWPDVQKLDIFCRSKRAAERVKESIGKFIEGHLKLKVNREKTQVAYIGRLKFLGYGFYVRNGKCRLRLHQKTEAKLCRRLITSRSNGIDKQKAYEWVTRARDIGV